jgi:hypothetical protein
MADLQTKVDYKRELGALYAPKRQPVVVDVPELSCLMIDGHGDPNTSPEYQAAIEALFAIAYTAKFAVRATGIDFHVMPLEGLWWTPDMAAFSTGDKSAWLWTMLIVQPPVVTAEIVEQARSKAATRKPLDAIALVRLDRFAEGKVAQVLHVGPYSTEGPTIESLHQFIAAQGYQRTGKHHEIYLGDPRRSAPDKLRTIVRQPIG